MKRRDGFFGAPPALVAMLSSIDFIDSDRLEFVIAHDLIERNHPGLGPEDFSAADTFVARLLADETVTNGDLKGLLKRLDLTVSLEYGGSARDFFNSLRPELAKWIQRLRVGPRR